MVYTMRRMVFNGLDVKNKREKKDERHMRDRLKQSVTDLIYKERLKELNNLNNLN